MSQQITSDRDLTIEVIGEDVRVICKRDGKETWRIQESPTILWVNVSAVLKFLKDKGYPELPTSHG